MKNLILFDVDGTLTKSRMKIENNMVDILKRLKEINDLDIGIVGGSDLKKQKEQLGENVLNDNLFKWVFSENGLVAFEDGEQFHCQSLVNKLGEKSYSNLVNICLKCLSECDNPVKRGNFIELRNGMINISPIGRSCKQDEREIFNQQDMKHNYRDNLIKNIKVKWEDYIYRNNDCKVELNFSVGGQISVDIFPKGWDKTYCLQFVEKKYKNIYFFGDKTHLGGNDFEIYNSPLTKSFSVNEPNDTINILNENFLV